MRRQVDSCGRNRRKIRTKVLRTTANLRAHNLPLQTLQLHKGARNCTIASSAHIVMREGLDPHNATSGTISIFRLRGKTGKAKLEVLIEAKASLEGKTLGLLAAECAHVFFLSPELQAARISASPRLIYFYWGGAVAS